MVFRSSFPLGLPVAALALSALLLPLCATAQDAPSYAHSAVVSTDETIHGRIASVDGAFSISVNDDRGFIDSVELHAGTIINPTGLTLSPGMSVTIAGYNAGSMFDANEIDTPYSYSGDLPTPVYFGPGYWCPGFAYGYGPSFSLAFIFGGGDRHFEHRPFHGRPWDGRGYFGDAIGRSGGERRGFIGERRATQPEASRDVPSGFSGRVFAGEPYAGSARRFAQPSARAGSIAGRAVAGESSGGGAARRFAEPGQLRHSAGFSAPAAASNRRAWGGGARSAPAAGFAHGAAGFAHGAAGGAQHGSGASMHAGAGVRH